jgi:acyl carrier protein phosphodiesterase
VGRRSPQQVEQLNYLAHLLLCNGRPEALVGSVLADFSRGVDLKTLSPGMRQAVELHFRVDAFTDSHPLVAESKRRIQPPHRRYAGVLVDMYYDHFLARHWDHHCDVPLPRFAAAAYEALLGAEAVLPERMVNVCRAMAAGDWLGSYARVDAIDTALQRMSRRLTRPNHLGTGIQALVENYEALEQDFERFFPELQRFASAACAGQA